MARHGRRHPADDRLHRGQLAHGLRTASGRRLGARRARVPPPPGPARDGAAGRQRPVRRRHRGRHRRASPARRGLLRARDHPQRRLARRSCSARSSSAGRWSAWSRVPGTSHLGAHGLAPLAAAGHAWPRSTAPAPSCNRAARPADGRARADPDPSGTGARTRLLPCLRLADRAAGRRLPRAGRRPGLPVPGQRAATRPTSASSCSSACRSPRSRCRDPLGGRRGCTGTARRTRSGRRRLAGGGARGASTVLSCSSTSAWVTNSSSSPASSGSSGVGVMTRSPRRMAVSTVAGERHVAQRPCRPTGCPRPA